MWRVAITKLDKSIESINLPTREECEEWILNKLEEDLSISSSLIMNMENKNERFLTLWKEK